MYKMKTEDSSSHFLTINDILILNFKKVSRILYWKSSHYNYLLKLKNLHTFTHHIFTKGSTLDHGLNSRTAGCLPAHVGFLLGVCKYRRCEW